MHAIIYWEMVLEQVVHTGYEINFVSKRCKQYAHMMKYIVLLVMTILQHND